MRLEPTQAWAKFLANCYLHPLTPYQGEPLGSLVRVIVTFKRKKQPVWTAFLRLSGKRDSNSRPQPWQGCALPTELFPQFSLKIAGRLEAPRYNQCLLLRSAFTNVPHFCQNRVWVEMDSNHRRRKPADLQSAPFGHSGIYPVH